MSVLITGVGPVGANVARKFIDEGYSVVLYDIVPRRVDFLDEVADKLKFVIGDITDFPHLLETAEKNGVEGIIATVVGPSNIDTPNFGYKVNIEGTQVSLEVARLKNLKLIFMSTASVYGERPDLNPLKEEDPTPKEWIVEPKGIVWSRNLYNAQKICSEILVTGHNVVYGLDTVIIRTSFVHGPGDRQFRDINLMLVNALKGKPIEVFGDEKKDFTYVKDLAQGIFLAYTKRPVKHRVFNMSGGKLYALPEVAEIVKKIIPGSQVVVKKGAGPFASVRGPTDITRAQKELGYEARPLEAGIKEHLEWLKKQPEMLG